MIDNSSLWYYDIISEMHDTIANKNLYDAIRAYPKKYWTNTQNRGLEAVAYDLYNDVEFWIIIAVYNDIIDPLEIQEAVFFIPKDELLEMMSVYKK